MGRLSQIRKEIAAEHGYSSWAEFGVMEPRMKLSIMHDEVARRYADEMVRHNLERVANKTHKVDGYSTIVTFTGLEQKAITSLEIELI